MTFAQAVAVTVYFGTPLAIGWMWWYRRRAGAAAVRWAAPLALGAWVLQAVLLLGAIGACLGGHCSGVSEAPVVVTLVAFAGIAGLMWVGWKWE